MGLFFLQSGGGFRTTSGKSYPCVRIATLIGADKKGLEPMEEEDMIEHSTDDPFGKFAAGIFLTLQQVETVYAKYRDDGTLGTLIAA